ncbi:hypothetical protein [Actinomycetospora straminea]|uniref:Uncharacterized protein n=1 Tax=Actinomycetospora straminea TaxID=663607 RepID=A0ABP9EA40_9PSEU|nr:hypothetical protein [Actinomycetospora straminea]MDD7935293.1 hypothetical protein [Actinomycetospora straminea]
MNPTNRRPSIGVLVGVLLAVLVVLAVVLFLLAQTQAAPSSPQTNGMIALLAPALL